MSPTNTTGIAANLELGADNADMRPALADTSGEPELDAN